jgi:hypothetical protein
MSQGRGPYTGQTKKLLVSVDIGTTFTAVSFTLLHPGEVPAFHDVSYAMMKYFLFLILALRYSDGLSR